MAIARENRDYKKKMGQYMTPLNSAKFFISKRNYKLTDKILEPSFGEGSFIISVIDRFIEIYNPENISDFVLSILHKNIFGIEMDMELYDKTINLIEKKYNCIIQKSEINLFNCDFFDANFFNQTFDYIEGNPPFGGSFVESKGILLDKLYGKYDGIKIKKETYSFFTYACYKLLKPDGQMGFICSDTFMTIPTMKGIRKLMMDNQTNIVTIEYFSAETNYPMVYFNLLKTKSNVGITIDDTIIDKNLILLTDTYSFNINTKYSTYFMGDKLSKYITCSSGMTIGDNEKFLKKMSNGKILETYDYDYVTEPRTILKEISRARLGKVSNNILNLINKNDIEEVLLIKPLNIPKLIDINDVNYKPYNKASSKKYFVEPTTYIYWKDGGKAVLSFKKQGPWYLHGVGGGNFFNKQGLTWRLISNDIRCRYLPNGYILDSGAPVGILKNGIDNDELYFIIGWLNTNLATDILKKIINHTRNIQSKDIERLPYPYWVSIENKEKIILMVKSIINNTENENNISLAIENLFIK
jgi:hypothetical protein